MIASPWSRIREGAVAASVAFALITIACGVIALTVAGACQRDGGPAPGGPLTPPRILFSKARVR